MSEIAKDNADWDPLVSEVLHVVIYTRTVDNKDLNHGGDSEATLRLHVTSCHLSPRSYTCTELTADWHLQLPTNAIR